VKATSVAGVFITHDTHGNESVKRVRATRSYRMYFPTPWLQEVLTSLTRRVMFAGPQGTLTSTPCSFKEGGSSFLCDSHIPASSGGKFYFSAWAAAKAAGIGQGYDAPSGVKSTAATGRSSPSAFP
jgi:hypothetical protein